ncbi:MAG: glycosyltransferase [Ignavibacteriales bacterium]|nr:glycosyltransferase [Ignavibacteriales bacterium]HOJ17294.1 glycosyltransferase [Ignavibacteriaceae bacterium]
MTFLTILFICLLVFYLLFILRVIHGIGVVSADRFLVKKDYTPSVTLIIPFRNEADVILDSLKCAQALDYPGDKLEVIYVDDHSDDEGCAKLKNAISENHIRIIKNAHKNSRSGQKKGAILTGINNSTGEVIFTTDADCTFQKNWIKTMVSKFDENVGFVSGPVFYEDTKTLFEKFQQMEFAGLVLVGAGLIGINKPLLCNGANIAYKRNVFLSVGGFEDNMNISSGDDEFLMQKIASTGDYEIKFCFENSALVSTKGCRTINKFVMQRRRWASKSLFYKDKIKVLSLIMIYLFYLSFPVMVVLGISTDYLYLRLFWFALVFKGAFELGVLKNAEFLFNKKINKFLFAVAQFFHIPYIIIIPLLGIYGNYEWKERKLKR